MSRVLILLALAWALAGCKLGSFADLNSNGSTNNNNGSGEGGGGGGGGLTFSTPVNVTSSHMSARSASAGEWNFLVDQQGNLYLVWEETDSIGTDRQVMFATRPWGGSWSLPVKLSQGTASDQIAAGTARLDVHPTNGHAYVVWQQGVRAYLAHNRSGGFMAASPVSAADTEPALGVAVKIDGGDNAHIVWTHARVPHPWRIVYRGMFGGTLDSAVSDVSNRDTHSTDDATFDPTGLALAPPSSGAQVVSVLYLVTTAGATYTLYTERPAGSGQSFGSIVDVSTVAGAHPPGSADRSPWLLFNPRGDLATLWTHTHETGVTNVFINPRSVSGSFKANADNATQASVGDSSNCTAPIALTRAPALDSSGGLHLFWEDRPDTGTNTYFHRYLAPIGVDPATVTAGQVGNTALTPNHQIRASLDLVDDLHLVWEESSDVSRDLIYRLRTAGLAGALDTQSLQLTRTSGESRLKSMAATAAGRVFVLFDESTGPVTYVVVRETGGTLSGPLNVSASPGIPCEGLSIRVDPLGTAHALFGATFNSSQKDIFYTSGS